MKNRIGPFSLYTKKPNDIKYGFIYTSKMKIVNSSYPEAERIVRVYLPEHFDESKEYPVVYMSDGQNMVDKYTSAYGAWNIDKIMHAMHKQGYPEFILVGIDCPYNPANRSLEYSFPFIPIKKRFIPMNMRNKEQPHFSHLFFKWIVETLKPLVDQHFPTSKERRFTATCGSSMGGVFALSLLTSYPDVFGIAFCFSPAYFLYPISQVNKYMNEALSRLDDEHRFYFYSGNVSYEHNFISCAIDMHHYLLKHGVKDENLALSLDVNGEHRELDWERHFPEIIRFWFK